MPARRDESTFTTDGCEMTDQAKQNRRNFVTSMMGGSLAAAAAAGLPAAEAQAESLPPEGLSADDAMAHYWNKPLSELVDIGPYSATPAEMERHRVYANLVLALLHGYFNGNKDGETGEYPWQPSQRIAGTGTQSLYAGGRYLGHNICCIAVDGDGDIIDFDFNHNSIFNSSVEHAEARLIKRIFSLADIHQDWDSALGTDDRWNLSLAGEKAPMRGQMDDDYGKSLSNVTIYTSLESCAQCSGIMTLANIKQVVFLQPDPSQYMIGKIMYRLSRKAGRPMAPAPRAQSPQRRWESRRASAWLTTTRASRPRWAPGRARSPSTSRQDRTPTRRNGRGAPRSPPSCAATWRWPATGQAGRRWTR